MKNIIKIAVLTGSIAPVIASAQLVNINLIEDADSNVPTPFFNTITAMNNDVTALFHPEGDSLALGSDIFWDGTNFTATDPGSGNHFQDISPMANFFTMNGEFSIGYLGNESNDDNELYMRASEFADGTGTQQMLRSTIDNGLALFDYDSNDPNSTDDPPMSYTFGLDQGVSETFVQFIHFNRTKTQIADQSNPDRFKIFAEFNDDNEYTGNYLMAIADRDDNYDSDRDDGFFFLQGDITPVPEPSHIAALAMLGLGAALVIRRRLRNKKQ